MTFASGKKSICCAVAVFVAGMIFTDTMGTVAQQSMSTPVRDKTSNLQMKITGPFTLAAVGDLILLRPATVYEEPAMQDMWKIIRGADIGIGNFEGQIRDEVNYTGPLAGFTGTKDVAPDLKKMGISMVGKANNHTMDSGEEGLYQQLNLLQDAGIAVAGAGRDLDAARAPHYQEMAKGRVGLVSVYSVAQSGQDNSATRRESIFGGRTGANTLHTTKITTVTAEQFAALKSIRDALYAHRTDYDYPANLPPDSDVIDLFGARYKVGPKPSLNTFTMNKSDLDDILLNIKNGKEYSHFMVVDAHVHELASDLEEFPSNAAVPDFEVTFAHDAIDNGADAFLGTGPHVLRGIEIYKGKPIFYDLGEFFHELNWNVILPSARHGLTLAEANEKAWDAFGGRLGGPGRGDKNVVNTEAMIAVCKYDKGTLQEVLIYPTEGRAELSEADSGVPRLADPVKAKEILERLRRLSAPFGTKIEIDGSVGTIRASGDAR